MLEPATEAINAGHEIFQTMTEGIHTLTTAMRTPITTSVKVVAKAVEDAAENQVEEEVEETVKTQQKLPTTEQTIKQLEGRLVDQISQLEDDFMDGARIDGLPCDCCLKHCRKLRDISRELLSMARKPVYNKVQAFAESHMWGPDEVGRHSPEFFVNMVPDLRLLRKELGSTEPDCPRCEKIKTATEFLREQRLKKAREKATEQEG